MSYSFSVKGATKQEVKDLAFTELTRICEQQPEHAADATGAFAAVTAYVEALTNDQSEHDDITVNVNGSVGWRSDKEIISAGISIAVHYTPKIVATA